MIDSVHLENFKSLRNTNVQFGRLTVLVGPNGSGKSSVLEAVSLASGVCAPPPEEYSEHEFFALSRLPKLFSGSRKPQRLLTQGSKDPIRFALHNTEGDVLELSVPVRHGRTESGEAKLTVRGPWGEKTALFPPLDVSREEGDAPDYPSPEQNEILLHPRVQQFGSAVYVRLNVSRMKAISVASEERPRMNVDGYGLPSVLAWMKGAEEERLAEITANARKIVPGIRRIKTLRKFVRSQRMDSLDVAGQKVWRPVSEERLGDRFEVEFDSGASVPADLLSEGTVVALGLLATLASKSRPRLILADDIDRGLHIEAQGKLVDVIRELLAMDPELQLVCTTHSPYLLDRFKPEEVRVLSLDSARHTHARSLTEHPDFEKWKFGNQTGELWAALGEAWVAPE